jgi:hypothetical protein
MRGQPSSTSLLSLPSSPGATEKLKKRLKKKNTSVQTVSVSTHLAYTHDRQDRDDREPVEDVGKHGADGRIVRPAEDGPEDLPAMVVELVVGIAAVEVPDDTADVVGAWAVTRTRSIVNVRAQSEGENGEGSMTLCACLICHQTAHVQSVKAVCQKVARGFTEQARANEK